MFPISPMMEETLMMRPLPRSTMWRNAAWERKKAPERLTSNTLCQSSSVNLRTAMLFDDLGDHASAVVGGGDVSPVHSRWRTELLLEVAHELFCLGGIPAESCGDLRPLGCKAGADGRSDTAGASSDES